MNPISSHSGLFRPDFQARFADVRYLALQVLNPGRLTLTAQKAAGDTFEWEPDPQSAGLLRPDYQAVALLSHKMH